FPFRVPAKYDDVAVKPPITGAMAMCRTTNWRCGRRSSALGNYLDVGVAGIGAHCGRTQLLYPAFVFISSDERPTAYEAAACPLIQLTAIRVGSAECPQ